jgi:hypothetical protein
MIRSARCQCGKLTVQASGEPAGIVACSCTECQRRTGSVFGVGAYYPEAQVTVSGDAREYVRMADSGAPFHTFFCPTCGTSLYWRSARNPGTLGVAVGAFADPKFPAPHRSVFEQSRHEWVLLDPARPAFFRGRDSQQIR